MKKLILLLSLVSLATFSQGQTCKPFLTGSVAVDQNIGNITWTKNTWITNPYTPVWSVLVDGVKPYAIFWVQQSFCSQATTCEVIYRGAFSSCLGNVNRAGSVGSVYQYNFFGGGYYFVVQKVAGGPYSTLQYIPYKPVTCDGCHDQCTGSYNAHP